MLMFFKNLYQFESEFSNAQNMRPTYDRIACAYLHLNYTCSCMLMYNFTFCYFPYLFCRWYDLTKTTTMASNDTGNDKRDKVLVAAIDFGTTYSGYAFSFKHDYQAGKLSHCVLFVLILSMAVSWSGSALLHFLVSDFYWVYVIVLVIVSIVSFLSLRFLLSLCNSQHCSIVEKLTLGS